MRAEREIPGTRFATACSHVISHRERNIASVRARGHRCGRSSDLGSVDHRGGRRPQPHSDFLDGQRPRPPPTAEADGGSCGGAGAVATRPEASVFPEEISPTATISTDSPAVAIAIRRLT